ncbi:uL15m family ribosomal protein [Natronobacterium gregoryi]|uniref:Large ribosomal subunit protein uL15 n=2 Tax=Natronobacterium gregoryi TaxID=44930 RepID=L0ACF8_NATGS|nr:uL15m family ribosomal protein [Natronobacterium gregoryi]AFZ71551.1 ribosomal protein L15 [Natronobacterium gregoryi SP2]ELY66608.1 50S ribosomal protein L15P [Natronobacterium gregoryi SP2]PLK21320.1 50S ribosomal protein L15 [Natronobacterium gregoryi SP2]SFI82107.1 LSU ribosomal protein L15P [Natronobacterium gregoryi]
MTSKKRRQRGSRTHSGGSHKNRRGAGHRGGRGRAGRSKHEFHNYEPKGKHGFKRPDGIREEVAEIDVRKLDEDAILYVAEGVAEAVDGGDGYRIDARDVVEDGHEVDVVKVLGSGQVRNQLEITADAFSDAAREKIEGAGGEATLTERGEKRDADAEDDESEQNEE